MSISSIYKNNVYGFDRSGSLGLKANGLKLTGGDITFSDGSTQSTASSTTPANWSDFPAVSNVDCSTFGIQDSSASIGTAGQVLSSQGNSVLWVDQPTPPDPTNWSDFPAVSNVDCSTFGIQDSSASLGTAGQVLSSQGNSVLWVDPPAPITTDPAPYGSNFLLANGQTIYDNTILTYASSGKTGILTTATTLKVDNLAGRINRIDPDQTTITANGKTINMNSSQVELTIDGSSSKTDIYSPDPSNDNLSFYSIGDTSIISMKTTPNAPEIKVLGVASSIAILTPTDLTFNGVEAISLIESLHTLKLKQITTTNQNISAAIYADAKPPLAPTTTIAQQYAFTPSWYFKNSFASNNKINWYIGADINMIVADVWGLYMNIFNGANTSNDNTPFITFYTKPQSGDSTFYHSKRTYIFDQTVSPTANTRYFMFQNMTSSCPTPFHYGSTLINMALSPVAGSNVGLFLPNEQILAFSIGTNSAAVINSIEFAIDRFGIITANGTQQLNFIPI